MRKGEIIEVKAGERIALDGEVISGISTLDTAALTGESKTLDVEAGSKVLSGCVNVSGALLIKVEKEYSDSTVSRILEQVERAAEKKAESEKFVSRFARVYTPIVCILALLLAFVPPLVFAQDFKSWAYRALELLVVSCPCALVISVPLSFFAGIGVASRKGILVKGSSYIEKLSKASTVVFDKTGTLTNATPVVEEVLTMEGRDEDEMLALAACSRDTMHDVKKETATVTSKIEENLDDMVDNGTVNDRDGYIDENTDKPTSPATVHATAPTVDPTVGDGMGAVDDSDGIVEDEDVTEDEFI